VIKHGSSVYFPKAVTTPCGVLLRGRILIFSLFDNSGTGHYLLWGLQFTISVLLKASVVQATDVTEKLDLVRKADILE
jgi:hypothetical protein